jgi:hypothetical protein
MNILPLTFLAKKFQIACKSADPNTIAKIEIATITRNYNQNAKDQATW